MRFAPLIAIFSILPLLFASPAWAITNGVPDGNAHPYVGALLNDHAYSDGTWSYCTGTLISPTVLVTAAHCGKARQKAANVTFSSQYHTGDAVYTGTYIADPGYDP